jgi:hypothetical protein
MALPVLKDHTQEAEDLLLWQWRDSPNVKGLLKSFTENLQFVEDSLFQLLDERGLYTAIGEQLDVLGRIVGEDRYGRSDEPYRVALIGRVTANNSDGSTEEAMQTLRAITQAEHITFFEHYPASVHYYASGGVTNGIVAALDSASSAGISTRVLYDLDQTMFLAAEFTTLSENILVNQLLENIQAQDADTNLHDITLGTYGLSTGQPRAIFPEAQGVSSQALLNPDFIDGLISWTTVSGTPSVASGTLSLDSGEAITQSITTVVSNSYSVMLDSLSTTGTFVIDIGTTSGGSEVASFTVEFDSLGDIGVIEDFIATATTTYITLRDTGGTSTVDGVYCGDTWTNTVKLNPLCDVIDATEFDLEIGQVIDDVGDTLIDNLGNTIKYIN